MSGMGSILDTIAAHAKERVAADRAKLPLESLKERCQEQPAFGSAFLDRLRKPGISFICEVKKASPSKKESILYLDVPPYGYQKHYERVLRREMLDELDNDFSILKFLAQEL